jgi:SAM-dependent methyltransferase
MPDTTIRFNDADAYERYMGRWSRAIGEKFLGWLAPPRDARWLDVGCGTGAFSEVILAKCTPASVAGVDPSPAQIEHARKAIPGAEFRVGDALSLPFGASEFDIVVSALVLHFLPDRRKAFSEMHRVARPGGIVAGYTWNRTAAETFAPYAPMARAFKSIGIEPTLSPLVPEASPDGLKATLDATGLRDAVITLIEVTRSFPSFDEFWQIQTMTFHPVGKSFAKCSDAERERIRDAVRQSLPQAADGSVSYPARAIAYKAIRA